MHAQHSRSEKVTVRIVEAETLLREGLCSLVSGSNMLSLLDASAAIDDLAWNATGVRPRVALMGYSADRLFFDRIQTLLAGQSSLRVVLLDREATDANIRQALKLRAAGYLTREQPFAEIEQALVDVASGKSVFAPAVAARLLPRKDGWSLAPQDPDSKIGQLSRREIEVLICLGQGHSVRKCAEKLGISPSTVDNHKTRLMKKLGVHKTVELTHLALSEGLIHNQSPRRKGK
jgi:DNA-binding NarL/FixJ family response regulator